MQAEDGIRDYKVTGVQTCALPISLAGDVAAVALGGDVLAEGVDGGAGDDLAADGALDGDLELLLGDCLGEALAVEIGRASGRGRVRERLGDSGAGAGDMSTLGSGG